MNRFTQALALVDALAQGGAALGVVDGGLDVDEGLPEALSRHLAAFCAGPELDVPPETLEAQLARSLNDATRKDGCDDRPVEQILEGARVAQARYRALVAVVAAPSRAARELLGLPIAYAVGLQKPFTVTFRRGGATAVCTTSREAYDQARASGAPAFVLRELVAVARAVELGRASGVDLDRWLAQKVRGEFVLSPEPAGVLGPLEHTDEPCLVSFGELFDALGAELVDVAVHELVETGKGAA